MNKIIFLFFTLLVGCVNNKKFIKSPFGKLDTLSTNDWWNRSDNPIVDLKVDRDDVIGWSRRRPQTGVSKECPQKLKT